MDDFEQGRRLQETKNERLLQWLRLTLLMAVFIGYLANYLVPFSPIPSSLYLLSYLGIWLLIGMFLLFYLQRLPPYRPLSKYFFAAIDLLVPNGALLIFSTTLPSEIIFVVSVGISTLAIILSSLRYDTGPVIFTGMLASLVHIAFLVLVPTPFWLPIAINTGIIFFAATVCVAFCVASLIQLHREAVWKVRLARFLAPELVQEISRKPTVLQQQTERRVATVLFTDIRGFTALSEHLSPEEVVAFLNLFLDAMTATIMDHHGMVDKYIGDAVMGVFGVPFAHEAHAALAVQAALSMQTRLVELNTVLMQRHLPQLGLGIGIHTGEVVAGAIGSTRRLDYTVIGDTVNVAARVEALTRHYSVTILLSDATRAALRETLPLQKVGTIEVKNRQQPVTVWTPCIDHSGVPD